MYFRNVSKCYLLVSAINYLQDSALNKESFYYYNLKYNLHLNIKLDSISYGEKESNG